MDRLAVVSSSKIQYRPPIVFKSPSPYLISHCYGSVNGFGSLVLRNEGNQRIRSVFASIHSEPMKYDDELLNSNEKRLAVVTGSNRGIGLEISRQLALKGITVIATARDEEKGKAAVELLHKESNFSNPIIFHQLDVCDSRSVSSLANFIQTHFGKLDILVNNAGVGGVTVDAEGLRSLNIDPKTWTSGRAVNMIQQVMVQTYQGAVNCLETNYYGLKRITEALLPFLDLSNSGASIVNLSSLRSELDRLPNEKLRNELRNIDNWNEKRLEEEVITKFLEDLKDKRLEEAGWSTMLPAYSVSKTVVNAYTRILAKRYPEMRINCVMPGFVNTEINWNTGVLTVEEGAMGPVMVALLPQGGPSGCYFDEINLAEAW